MILFLVFQGAGRAGGAGAAEDGSAARAPGAERPGVALGATRD